MQNPGSRVLGLVYADETKDDFHVIERHVLGRHVLGRHITWAYQVNTSGVYTRP